MRVLVCGSRSWTDRRAIERRLKMFAPGTVFIHGGARGADLLAEDVALAQGDVVTGMLPDYATHGRRAPLERNIAMLDMKPDLVLAFWDGRSTGTTHTLSQAKRRGIPVEVITS